MGLQVEQLSEILMHQCGCHKEVISPTKTKRREFLDLHMNEIQVHFFLSILNIHFNSLQGLPPNYSLSVPAHLPDSPHIWNSSLVQKDLSTVPGQVVAFFGGWSNSV